MTSVPTSGGAPAQQRGLRIDPDQPRVLHVEGDVDVHAVLRLAEARGSDRLTLGRDLAAAGVREAELTRATFIDSSVIALLLAVSSHQPHGRLSLRGASGSPLMALEASRVQPMFDLVDVGPAL
jgi:ABC-type transporter Mla MlaB component